MWDLGGFASGLFEHPLNEYKGVQVSRLIHDYYAADAKRGFYGGAGIDARFDWTPIRFGLDGLPPDGPQWGSEYKKMFPDGINAADFAAQNQSFQQHLLVLHVERPTVFDI